MRPAQHIRLPFRSDFEVAMLEGTKTKTCRVCRLGLVGDMFHTPKPNPVRSQALCAAHEGIRVA